MIRIVDGDLFDSTAQLICHQCNCQGVMGSGVAAEVRRRYPHVFESYQKDFQDGKLALGYVNFAEAKQGQFIANMCGQDKYGYDGSRYTNYGKLQECLQQVKSFAVRHNLKTIAFPYLMSSCRGGGNWEIVLKMISITFKDFDVEIWRLNKG